MLKLILLLLLATTVILILAGDAYSIGDVQKGDIARFIWYATILIALSSGVLYAYRKRASLALNHFAIWMLIATVLLVGYTFKNEIQMIAGNSLAALIPGMPYSQSNARGERTVTIRASRDGHFNARTSVNGISVNMLVDTGASAIALTYRDAENIGIDVARLSYNIPLRTANGIAYAARVKLDHLAVGDIFIHNIDAFVARPQAMDKSLLGMNWLNRLNLFEFRDDRLILKK